MEFDSSQPERYIRYELALNGYLVSLDLVFGTLFGMITREFGVLAGNFKDAFNFAKKLSSICDLIIYKKGEKGSITFVENKEIYKGIFPVIPLKPTGAGDAFMGALIGALLKDYDIEKSIEI